MSGNGDGGAQGRLRLIAGVVILVLIIVVVLTDVFGRLFVDSTFRVSDLMLGTLIGALLLLVGIDVSKRWPFGGPK
jgi:uncharacterized membrane protein YgaE (UPF0421/DUF939 family)